MTNEGERLARLESKMDSIQFELTEFKDMFHKEFSEHQKDDKENFDKINQTQKKNEINIAKMTTRLNIWGGIIIVFVPVFVTIIKKVL